MNGVDYTQRLNRQRELYQKEIADNNRAHRTVMDDMQEAKESQLKENADNFHAKKLELEKKFGDRYDELNKSQKEALSEKNKEYEQAINAEKKQFSELSRNRLKDWNKKISDIQNSYKYNLEDSKEMDEKIRDQIKTNADKRVKDVLAESEAKVKEYQSNALGSSKSVQEKLDAEKRQLSREHERDLNRVYRDEVEKRNVMKDRLSRDVANIRQAREEESERLQLKTRENIDKVNQDAALKLDKTAEQTRTAMEKINMKQKEEVRKQNLDLRNEMMKQTKQHHRDMEKLEMKHKAAGIGAGSLQSKLREDQRAEQESQKRLRSQNYLDQRERMTRNFEKAMDEARENFQDTYRDMSIKSADKLVTEKRELTDLNIKERLSDRRKFQRASNDHDLAMKFQQETSHDTLQSQRKLANKQIETLKKKFGESMDDALERSQLSMKSMKDEMNKEKRELSEKLHEQNAFQEKFLRAAHAEKIEKLTDKYEEKLQGMQNKNEELRSQMHNKIKEVIEQTTREMDRQRGELEKSAKIEKANLRSVAEQQENELRKRIDEVHNNYTRKMDQDRLNNQSKVKELTFKYENQLKDERTKYQDIIDHNNRFFERELMRLKMSSDSERDRLITQYEGRIKQLQSAFQNKQRELEQFNQLQS